MKIRGLLLIICLGMLLFTSSLAWGECVDDNNNTAETAQPVGFQDSIEGVVCPDDAFDYYTFEIPERGKIAGKVVLESEQAGTVLKITGPDGVIFEKGTSDDEFKLEYTLPSTRISAGIYYARVSYWSRHRFDHNYTLILDLTLGESDRIKVKTPEEKSIAGFEVVEEKPYEMATPTLKDIPVIKVGPTVPWPSVRGDSRNRSWSTYNGPGASVHKSAEFNILQDAGLSQNAIDDKFFGLIAGVNNNVYFAYDQAATYVSYDLSSGLKKYEILGWLWYYLDGNGLVYLLDYYENKILCRDPSSTDVWNLTLGNAPNDLWAVGERIYTSHHIGSGIDNIYLEVREKDKSMAWSVGPLNGGAIGLGEDPNAAVYFHTQKGLYQFDWDGNQRWYIPFPESSTFMTYTADDFSVIVGQDHRVLVHHPWAKKLMIYNPDSTVFHQYDYTNTPGNEPVAICSGAKSTLYIATKDNRVVCYDNWKNQLWQKKVSTSGGIEDMIMGQDGKVYVLYHAATASTGILFSHHWVSLDPDTGSQIAAMSIEMPSKFHSITRGELAIGESNKLIYLNSGGYMVVFSPAILELVPNFKEIVPFEKLEKRK